jgi:hypothetical protein
MSHSSLLKRGAITAGVLAVIFTADIAPAASGPYSNFGYCFAHISYFCGANAYYGGPVVSYWPRFPLRYRWHRWNRWHHRHR